MNVPFSDTWTIYIIRHAEAMHNLKDTRVKTDRRGGSFRKSPRIEAKNG